MNFLPIDIKENKIFIYQLISEELMESLQKEELELKLNSTNIPYIDYDSSSLIKLQNILRNSKDELIDTLLYKKRAIPYL